MVVEIDEVKLRGQNHGVLFLRDGDEDVVYGGYPFREQGSRGGNLLTATEAWTWTNPEEGLDYLTITPSIEHESPGRPHIHVSIEDGEVQHHDDCSCGCS